MQKIELLGDSPFTLPEGALCLGSSGWLLGVLEEVRIEISDTSMDLSAVLDRIQSENRGLLGPGDLTFKVRSMSLHPTGYLVFLPDSEKD